MKIGLLVVLFLLLLFFFMRSDARKIALENGTLRIYDKQCSLQIPVKRVKRSSNLIDELSIERDFLQLPNKQEIVMERIDLTDPKHSIGMPYNELVNEIFGAKFQEFWQKDGMVIYAGDFYVALFYKSKDDLILLYPLGHTFAQAIAQCKEPRWSTLHLPSIKLSTWDIRLIITEGVIKKNI